MIETAFINACRAAQKTVVMAFLKKGGLDLDYRDDDGNTALFHLCAAGAKDLVHRLIEAGADSSLANNSAETPLHAAARFGSPEIIRLLAEHGVDLNAADNEDATPLIRAVKSGKTEAALCLLSLHADAGRRDKGGRQALDYAAGAGLYRLTEQLKPAAGVFADNAAGTADNAGNLSNAGNSPLHEAVGQNRLEAVRVLLDSFDVNARNNEGDSPLLLAIANSNAAIAELLLASGASADISRPNGNGPLHLAAAYGNAHLGEALLDRGADINRRNEDGETPLVRAVKARRKDFSLMLIRRGADTSVADNAAKTALDYAGEYGFSGIADALLKGGSSL